jgi:hypothetical protein
MGSSTNIILPNYGEPLTTGKRNNIDVVLWYIISSTTHWRGIVFPILMYIKKCHLNG